MKISFPPAHVVIADYSDGNGNVSGGESEDESEAKKEQTIAEKDDEIPTPTHHSNNEIEESLKTTTAPTIETSTPPAQNLTLPCDSDRGGCDHECQMLKYD